MLRAVVLVITGEQLDVRDQEETCRAYCEEHGVAVAAVAEGEDAAIESALHMIERGEASVVLAARIDVLTNRRHAHLVGRLDALRGWLAFADRGVHGRVLRAYRRLGTIEAVANLLGLRESRVRSILRIAGVIKKNAP